MTSTSGTQTKVVLGSPLPASLALVTTVTTLGSHDVARPAFLASGSLWLVLGVLVVIVAAVGAVYLYIQIQRSTAPEDAEAGYDPEQRGEPEREPPAPESAVSPEPRDASEPEQVDEESTEKAVDPETRQSVLDSLPEDERKILGPILESPGLTQVDVREHSGFSKSKVSQTVNDLEDRGLIEREREGRTFAIYPGENLTEAANEE